jgi:hypothetical protein
MGRKDDTLGMPHGTASHRLRKKILFHLLKKLNENYCFKCSEPIENINDLTIEHKQPWEGISAELFWDLDNIAFSHLRCNVPHRQSGGPTPIKRPEGMNWCSPGKHFAPLSEFYRDRNNQMGLQHWCKAHRYKR